jgi:hypothetical protein
MGLLVRRQDMGRVGCKTTLPHGTCLGAEISFFFEFPNLGASQQAQGGDLGDSTCCNITVATMKKGQYAQKPTVQYLSLMMRALDAWLMLVLADGKLLPPMLCCSH